MSYNAKSKLLISAGVIATAAAIWHLLCIFGGPSWFTFARAPQQIIESSQQGTLLAPVGTVLVASLMFMCTVYAFSAVGIIAKVPLIKSALITIAILCLLRGLIAIPIFINSTGPDLWQIIASTVWFYVGICFSIGAFEQYSKIKAVV